MKEEHFMPKLTIFNSATKRKKCILNAGNIKKIRRKRYQKLNL